jgi:hypothetical protein
VGALEGGLGAGASRRPRAVDATDCRTDWEQDPGLEPAYNPMLGRIRILAESGLTPMMVLHDFVSKRITPLQVRTHLAWLYTRVNDVTQLERGDGSTLREEALVLVMGKLSPDPSSHDLVAVKKKAGEEAVAKKVAEEAVKKRKVVQRLRAPAPSAGVKRAAAPSGSIPPAKRRFHGSWKLQYAM